MNDIYSQNNYNEYEQFEFENDDTHTHVDSSNILMMKEEEQEVHHNNEMIPFADQVDSSFYEGIISNSDMENQETDSEQQENEGDNLEEDENVTYGKDYYNKEYESESDKSNDGNSEELLEKILLTKLGNSMEDNQQSNNEEKKEDEQKKTTLRDLVIDIYHNIKNTVHDEEDDDEDDEETDSESDDDDDEEEEEDSISVVSSSVNHKTKDPFEASKHESRIYTTPEDSPTSASSYVQSTPNASNNSYQKDIFDNQVTTEITGTEKNNQSEQPKYKCKEHILDGIRATELCKLVGEVIKGVENSFVKNQLHFTRQQKRKYTVHIPFSEETAEVASQDELVELSNSEKYKRKRNAYRLCPICKKAIGAFGTNYRSHVRKCCPVVYREIMRQNEMFFGTYEQLKAHDFFKHFISPFPPLQSQIEKEIEESKRRVEEAKANFVANARNTQNRRGKYKRKYNKKGTRQYKKKNKYEKVEMPSIGMMDNVGSLKHDISSISSLIAESRTDSLNELIHKLNSAPTMNENILVPQKNEPTTPANVVPQNVEPEKPKEKTEEEKRIERIDKLLRSSFFINDLVIEAESKSLEKFQEKEINEKYINDIRECNEFVFGNRYKKSFKDTVIKNASNRYKQNCDILTSLFSEKFALNDDISHFQENEEIEFEERDSYGLLKPVNKGMPKYNELYNDVMKNIVNDTRKRRFSEFDIESYEIDKICSSKTKKLKTSTDYSFLVDEKVSFVEL